MLNALSSALGSTLDSVNAVARKLAPYAKAIVAAAGVAVVIARAIEDGNVSVDEVKDVAIAIGVATGVYAVPNRSAV